VSSRSQGSRSRRPQSSQHQRAPDIPTTSSASRSCGGLSIRTVDRCETEGSFPPSAKPRCISSRAPSGMPRTRPATATEARLVEFASHLLGDC
jgi:hypothetical protein